MPSLTDTAIRHALKRVELSQKQENLADGEGVAPLRHARQRRMTWPLVGLGLLIPLLIALILIH